MSDTTVRLSDEDVRLYATPGGQLWDDSAAADVVLALAKEVQDFRRAEVERADLLRRYMDHVRLCEGITFVDDDRRTDSATEGVTFTDAEWAHLRALDAAPGT